MLELASATVSAAAGVVCASPLRAAPTRAASCTSAANDTQSHEGQRAPELVCASPTSTLAEALALLAGRRLHRLHVTDARRRPVGIVTLTDVLRVVVGASELLVALGPVRLGVCVCVCGGGGGGGGGGGAGPGGGGGGRVPPLAVCGPPPPETPQTHTQSRTWRRWSKRWTK
jgi:hypothetical protein